MTAFRVGSASHVGQVRSNNQDSWLVFDEEAVYAVADGMGGHQGGEVASAIAVETLEATIAAASAETVVEAVKEANRRIISRATDTTELRGMGTTLVAIALVNRGTEDEEIAWVNVGDSRAYLLRDGELIQLSRDHSLVEDLRRGGQLSDEEAAVHPQRNILTRALGIDREVEVDSDAVMPLLGDRFLLCSDGLFNEVDRAGIITTLSDIEDPDAAAAELVRRANEGGGRDNITCVVVDVTDDDGRAARAAELAAAAAAAAAEARRDAAAAGGAPADEVDIDTIETVGDGDATPLVPTASAAGAAALPVEPVTEPATEPVDDDGVLSDDDPTPPNGTPLPPPPPPAPAPTPAAEAPTEPVTVDPDPGGATGAAASSEAFINPGFPTEDGTEVAGSERFINAGFPTADEAPAAAADDELPFGADRPEYRDPDAGNRSHRTKILAGVAIVVVLVALVVGGLTWYGGQGYFVALDDGQVAIYEGQPGGFLWVEPSLVETTDATLSDAAAADARDDVIEKRTFSSLGDARAFVTGIEDAAAEEPDRSTTTTEDTTTTTERSTTTSRPAQGASSSSQPSSNPATSPTTSPPP